MFYRIFKYITTLLYPPYFGKFDLLVGKIFKPEFSGSKINLIEDKGVSDYLEFIPSTNAIITHNEAIALYKAAFFLGILGDVIEIGTWRGGSTLVLASALKDSGSNNTLHTIDPYNSERDKKSRKLMLKDIKLLKLKNLKENYYYATGLIRKFHLNPYVRFHISKSAETAKKWKRDFSFVFVDGNHSHSFVKKDIELWGKILSAEGMMAIHDYKNNTSPIKGLPGPTLAVNQLLKNNSGWIFCGQTDSLIFFRKRKN